MTLKRALSRVVTIAIVVAFVGLLLSGWLGQPVVLGYVTTESMAPTLAPSDGFIAVPAAVSGPVATGDVITFRAEVLHGGELTTHRVVGTTEGGYITKGDNNPITDQSGSAEPPVRDAQIVATALQVGGWVVPIPGLGHFVTGSQSVLETTQYRLAGLVGSRFLLGTQGLATLTSILLFGVYAVDVWKESTRNEKSRTRTRSRDDGSNPRVLVGALALLLVAATTAGMVGPSTTHEFQTVQLETESATLHVSNSASIPMVVYLEPKSEQIAATPTRVTVPPRSTEQVTVTVRPPDGTTDYRRYLGEHRYTAILPRPVLDVLYEIHPLAPVLAIDGLVGGAFYALGIWLIGQGRVRDRVRERSVSLLGRSRRRSADDQ